MHKYLLACLLLLKMIAVANAQQFVQEDKPQLDEAGIYGSEASFADLNPSDACGSQICYDSATWRVFGGAEYLLVRPHFSEAVAFARGSQTATTYNISGEPILFDYDSGIRAFAGIRLGQGSDSVRISYTHMQGDVSINGTAGAGQFIVDPFGNVVGSVAIINPADARFGTVVNGGDLVRASSSVETNVYDVDFAREWDDCFGWSLRLDVGVRIADIDQTYDSVVTLSGAPFATGTFSAAFTGAGPRLGFAGKKYLDSRRRFSIRASAHGALLLGDYDVVSGNVLGGGVFTATQANTQLRMIPVFESDVGASWRMTDAWELSGGWLFHVWNDLGVSGGTFGGLFVGADDANNMSFDGLFIRAEYRR